MDSFLDIPNKYSISCRSRNPKKCAYSGRLVLQDFLLKEKHRGAFIPDPAIPGLEEDWDQGLDIPLIVFYFWLTRSKAIDLIKNQTPDIDCWSLEKKCNVRSDHKQLNHDVYSDPRSAPSAPRSKVYVLVQSILVRFDLLPRAVSPRGLSLCDSQGGGVLASLRI